MVEAVMELLIASLKETLIKVLCDKKSISIVQMQLQIKLSVIKEGLKIVLK